MTGPCEVMMRLAHADRLVRRGTLWEPRPVRRRASTWSLWGPLLPIALGLGLLVGTALALWGVT